MSKTFEDLFSELQAEMILACLEYAEKRADKIYVYCSFEDMTISCDFFFLVNNILVKKHELNDTIGESDLRYDTSVSHQNAIVDIIIGNIEKLIDLCNKHKKVAPTEIKLVYDVKDGTLKADYRYDLVYSKDNTKTADDIVIEWFEKVNILRRSLYKPR